MDAVVHVFTGLFFITDISMLDSADAITNIDMANLKSEFICFFKSQNEPYHSYFNHRQFTVFIDNLLLLQRI